MTAFVILVLGLTALGILTRYLRNRDRLRAREMAHRERVIALEKGVAATDLPEAPVTDAWVDEPWTTRALDAGWDRRIALAIGLVLLFGGIGMTIALFALTFVPGPQPGDIRDLMKMFPLGFIPVMIGLGLLLYYRLTAARSGANSREVQLNGGR